MNKQLKMVMDVHQKPKPVNWLMLSFQHLFAMFGATIFVPYIVGLDPAVALISSGLGTLAYLLITRGQIPAYLGSSFAFIAPIQSVMLFEGPEAVMFGSFMAGVAYGLVSMLIRYFGTQWIRTILPPVVVGPVIIVIGLALAGTAIDMAMTIPGSDGVYDLKLFSAALVTLAMTIIAAIFFKGFYGLIPILFGIISGYAYSAVIGIIDFSDIREAKLIGFPSEAYIPFVTYDPVFSWSALISIVSVALVVTLAEHIGDQMVISKVMERNLLRKPGLHRSIMGDGVATIIASLIGGPPNTTYGENVGVLAITRVFSVFVIAGAAVLAVLFGFSPLISAIISSIPTNVMGGVAILLFGIIAASGLRLMIESELDFGHKRNLVIASVILIIGIGGAFIQVTDELQVPGMALAAIIGIALNLLLPGKQSGYGKKPMFAEK